MQEFFQHTRVPQLEVLHPPRLTKKKPPESSNSSEDETFERPSKKVGRKSLTEAREEEAEKQKMQGSQATIEMSISRNTRARPSEGDPPPSVK